MKVPRFLYHASATGVGGWIDRPFDEILEVQAPSALPPSGGFSRSTVRDIRIRDFFSCARASTETTGQFQPSTQTYETRALSIVEKFNIAGVVTVDLIRAQVRSSHKLNSDEQPSIVVDGTAIINFRIYDKLIELEPVTELFTELSTLNLLRKRHREDEQFRRRIQDHCMVGRVKELEEHKLERYFPFCRSEPTDKLPENQYAAILPLYRIKTESGPGFRAIQNTVHIENFGRVHLGELIATGVERRVNGFHVDLGSDTGGEISGGSVIGNGGQTDPPPPGGDQN